MLAFLTLALLAFAGQFPATPATAPAASGEVIELGEATTLVIPEHFRPGPSIDLLVHFHGGGQMVAGQMAEADINAVLLVFSPGGRSSAYSKPFEDEARFGRMLDEALQRLRAREQIADDAEWGDIWLSSFSAGFGAVREILKQPRYVEQVDGILMADSLYCGYAGDPADKQVDPELMAPFTAFAKKAAAGEKVLILTHSYIQPPGYAGTHETADFLIDRLGIESHTADEPGPDDMHINRRAQKSGFHVIGCAGDTAADHVRHLQNLGHWLPLLPRSRQG